MFSAFKRFFADPRQSIWLGAVLVLTWMVWNLAHDTVGAGWIIMPALSIVPFVCFAVLACRIFMPPFRPLNWLAIIAFVVLIGWFLLLPTGALPNWHASGTRLSLTAILPIFFLYTALRGRAFFVRSPERWVFEGRWALQNAPHLFDEKPLYTWGFVKKPFKSLRLGFYLFRAFAITAFLVAASLPFAKRWALRDVAHDDKAFEAVTSFDPFVTTRVRAAGGQVICRFAVEDREFVPVGDVPPHVRQAFIASEDKHFYRHDGIDPVAIVRAFFRNHAAHRTVQGGSTISQQVVKQLMLKTDERTFTRKIREMFLVVDLERRVSKDKILEVYLNHILLGRSYGVQAAARSYYGKDVNQLTIGEAAYFGGMPKGPTQFSPSRDSASPAIRQAYVLGRMREHGFITQKEYDDALNSDVAVVMDPNPLNKTVAPFICAFIRHQVTIDKAFGQDALFKKGLTIDTTFDLGMQMAAEAAVRTGLLDLERRMGFTGPEGHDETFRGCRSRNETVRDESMEIAVVTAVFPMVSVCVEGETFRMHPDDQGRIVEWEAATDKALKVGDTLAVKLRTYERPKGLAKGVIVPEGRFAVTAHRTAWSEKEHPDALEATLMAMDPRTGYMKAMVGGFDFNENQQNIAVQSRRQVGSSVKPYVYGTALRKGMVVTDMVNDHPVCYSTASGLWCPQNYKGPHTAQQYMGAVDLRTALAKSLNSISTQLAAKYGIDEVIATMRALGVRSEVVRALPIAVGAVDLTPWEHTAAYAGIAAGGKRMPSQFGNATPGIFITKIADASGRTLYAYKPEPMAQAMPAADAYSLIHLMKGVVQDGTAKRAQELGRPAAGKTGTTNSFKDAWFMGFTADLVAGVWVGRMTPAPIGKEATGGAVALPIWLGFMKPSLTGTAPRDFPVPDDVQILPGPKGPVPFPRGRVPKNWKKTSD